LNVEVKVSLGGATHTKFNFVQIRPSHCCETYLLLAYHLSIDNVDEEGTTYMFRVPKTAMETLILSYGTYAHGTTKEQGKITLESIKGPQREYSLRPVMNDNCWKELLKFEIPEKEL
jgi:hypothetical protein